MLNTTISSCKGCPATNILHSNIARARASFASPDRFIPQRSIYVEKRSSYQTSHPPVLLPHREQYHRQRDTTLSPFRSVSGTRSRDLVRQRRSQNVYDLRPPHYTPSFIHGNDTTPAHVDANTASQDLRQPSVGFWTVGGRLSAQTGQLQGITSASAELLVSGSTAPLHAANFLDRPTREDKVNDHERRLALALDIDPATRILLQFHDHKARTIVLPAHSPFVWADTAWKRQFDPHSLASPKPFVPVNRREKGVPTIPFRVLDAPNLKDDYYCSILAYSRTCHTLAVALTQKVYLWTEKYGVRYPPIPPVRATNFVTSLAFSSEEGGKAILAVARNSGTVTLWSLLESRPRFEAPHLSPATCVAFKPSPTRRQSARSSHMALSEDLLVGDDTGTIHYYSLEWPNFARGSLTLLAKIDAHSQNICGLAWSPDGRYFMSGGNDNRALLFDADFVLETSSSQSDRQVAVTSGLKRVEDGIHGMVGSVMTPEASPDRRSSRSLPDESNSRGRSYEPIQMIGLPSPPPTPLRSRPVPNFAASQANVRADNMPATNNSPLHHDPNGSDIIAMSDVHMYSFYHAAAVKAIAFAPWQPTLVATGGGSNDRQIHFFHAESGATLALINVFSQVTSLVWSTTRREIVATFGYSQPEHDIRIAVFSWPSCDCIMSIPWDRKQNGEIGRALWAIPYPGGPNDAVPTRRQDPGEDGFAA
ncbi:hypothetical protein B0A52_10027 [Exophiala mesophila]|uniref:Uncharacterized protein n=1 Tax=Exophiala mesophila TaxID=212818 RepID=A0A438MSP9_EXOME|nr:hypothetical protein B0A52_10027 [Exophiala mesophila]